MLDKFGIPLEYYKIRLPEGVLDLDKIIAEYEKRMREEVGAEVKVCVLREGGSTFLLPILIAETVEPATS